MRTLVAIVSALALAGAIHVAPGRAAAPSRSVALTFDDLPAAGTQDVGAIRSINLAILESLARHHAPATGFVIGRNLEAMPGSSGADLRSEWTRRGFHLGSHTYSHADLNNLGAAAFEREVIANERVLGAALPRDVGRYLRFPFNHLGETKEKHDAVLAFLATRGYTVAACTIDTSDYMFADAYRLLLAHGDEASAGKLRREYVKFTGAEIEYYESLARQVFGRDIPQVMLLHANRLNADLIDRLLAALEERHYRFVTLDEAQADPAYRTPDTVVTKFGPMWGYRWARERHVSVNGATEPEPPAWIVRASKGGFPTP